MPRPAARGRAQAPIAPRPPAYHDFAGPWLLHFTIFVVLVVGTCLVYQRDQDFGASLPAELRGPMQRWYDRFGLSLDDYIALFEGLHAHHHNKRRVKVQLAPANLHWCSDEALTRLAETSP